MPHDVKGENAFENNDYFSIYLFLYLFLLISLFVKRNNQSVRKYRVFAFKFY